MEQMRIAVFHDVCKIVVEKCPIPEVSAGQILMRVDVCALCTWEQRVYTGIKGVQYPFIGGHEMAGEIVALGEGADERSWSVGDQIVYGTNLACGSCYYCKIHEEQNCQYFDHHKHLKGLPYHGMGGLSQYLSIEPQHAFKFYRVTPHEASLSEPLSCVIHSSETARVEYGDFVVVIGCGIMGLLHCQLAAKSGAVVIASDPNEKRLKLANDMGAHYLHCPKEESLSDFVMELTNNFGAQVVFDTTPISQVAEDAVGLLAQLGRLVLYSSFYPDEPVSFSPDSLHKKGQIITGTANSNSRDFMKATRMISEGIIDVKPCISEIFPLEKVDQAFESAVQGDKFRVQIELHGEET